MLTHGSLFAGIGGFDLGFERAGIRTVWQVEIDAYCRRVLEKHFPQAQRFSDIRDCCGCQDIRNDPTRGIRCAVCDRPNILQSVDVLSGGFPCQDISNAGKRTGIDGERSGLWSEYARVIRELRPRYVVVENVAALLGRGMERVLGDLVEAGYDAEWCCISASDLGAPHRRERVWIIAYPMRDGRKRRGRAEGDLFPVQRETESAEQFWNRWFDWPGAVGKAVADTERHAGALRTTTRGQSRGFASCGTDVADANQVGLSLTELESSEERTTGTSVRTRFTSEGWWTVEPDVGRVAHGIPARVDRLRGLGNAIVPQIAEWIGRRIVSVAGAGVSSNL